MKKYNLKLKVIILIILTICSMGINSYAHSGRTDANGGHRDNKNKSGLGSYHYHCGGHPAHLHPNGVCPYSSKKAETTTTYSKPNTNNNKNTNKSETIKTEPTIIAVESIQIKEIITTLYVGDVKFLETIITPDNATDKKITWKSSDESIVKITTGGMITAMKSGTVDITGTTSNGKSSTITVSVEEKVKVEDNYSNNILSNSVNSTNTTNYKNNQEGLGAAAGVLTLSAVGGCGYLGYKKYNKNNKE